MIITIEGSPSEGKSTLAKYICHGKIVFEATEQMLNSPFWANEMSFYTEIIVVDEVSKYRETREFFKKEFLEINKRGKHPIRIKMPYVVLIIK